MRRRKFIVVAAALAMLAVPGYARASGPSPATVQGLASFDVPVDGAGHCLAVASLEKCNVYDAKQFAWLTGGLNGNGLPDGTYFFAVIAPGGSPLDGSPNLFPKPATDGNLSDDFDPYTNRTFTIKNGEIFSYAGTHTFGVDPADNNEKKIRVFPYSESPNSIYLLAVCPLAGFDAHGNPFTVPYPPDPASCTYDAFKVGADPTAPTCTTGVSTNNSGHAVISVTVQDPQSGVETIAPTSTNATVALPTWTPGTTSELIVTGTQTNSSQAASLSVVVTSVTGQSATCGAEAPVADLTPPTCVLTATIPGPPKQIQVTVQDTGSGISSIGHTETNAQVAYSLSPGTTSSVVVTATKLDQSKGSFLALTVTNGAGGVTVCDPVVPAAKPRTASHARVKHARASAHGGPTLGLDSGSVLYGVDTGVTLRGTVPSKRAGQTVMLLSRPCGFTDASRVATLKTGTGGAYEFRIQPGLNTAFSARWKGMTSKAARVNVRPLTALRRVSPGHYRVDVSTTNGVFLAGRQVQLQRASGSHWTTIARATLAKASPETEVTVVSAATFAVHASGAKLRIVVPRTACYAGAVSAGISA
jgi:hypothetical protein